MGGNYNNRFAGMDWRNLKTGLDPTPNRMYYWDQVRWLSSDPRFQDLLRCVNFPP
jgi:hypothetical protein